MCARVVGGGGVGGRGQVFFPPKDEIISTFKTLKEHHLFEKLRLVSSLFLVLQSARQHRFKGGGVRGRIRQDKWLSWVKGREKRKNLAESQKGRQEQRQRREGRKKVDKDFGFFLPLLLRLSHALAPSARLRYTTECNKGI